jgi:hypothetical protein
METGCALPLTPLHALEASVRTEAALRAAERRRTTLQADLPRRDRNRRAARIQLPHSALKRHPDGTVERLRSGVPREVRDAIEPSISRILLGLDGGLTIAA